MSGLSLMTLIDQMRCFCATRHFHFESFVFHSAPFAHLTATILVRVGKPSMYVYVYSSLTLMRETKRQSVRVGTKKKAPVICIIFPLMRLEIVS